MRRLCLKIEYDGTLYHGWQRQKDVPSVQQTIEERLFAILGEHVILQCAGRTDAGVHAFAQIAHFDCQHTITPNRLREALNAHLRQLQQPITILETQEVSPTFDARKDALKRIYVYRILARRVPPALNINRLWHVPVSLNVQTMHEAAQVLVGHHDFSTFRDKDCQAKSPIKTIDSFEIKQVGEEIECWVQAQSFLHSQVRSMVGSLKNVGQGKWSVQDLQNALEAKNRTKCGIVAPPYGLYLAKVIYPK